MKFILTYSGELRSNDGYERKWEIRKQFDPQLRKLWLISPALKRVEYMRHLPKTGFWQIDSHHTVVGENPSVPTDNTIDILAPIKVRTRSFNPLVRDSLALKCGLKILFLRQEDTGRIYQGGDLDNRLKTLFDALSVPNADQIVDDPTIDDPIFCLLENDCLITKIDVDTQRLLSRQDASKHDVQLIIEADVRVTQSRTYNQPFLGD
jgi:hypothetical protein